MAQVAALSHEGVSCDGCMMPNFSGCRYKCLRCWDFDLCHACYTADRFQVDPGSDQVHDREHPMQCILSHHDFEMFYADDETRNYSTCRIAVLTCPYCNERGFGYSQFYEHVMRNHADPMPYQVNCPLCIGLVDTESANRVVDNLKHHWTSIHYLYAPVMQTTLVNAPSVGTDTVVTAQPPAARLTRAGTAAAAAAALAAPDGAIGGAVAPGPFDLPPTARNGARRPMMARRAARQQPGDRTDRENRTENREQRQQAAAAAAFGMPWTENDEVQDLFRLVQRNDPTRAAAAAVTDRGRMQRLRNLQATLQQGAPGNLIANADFIQRIIGSDPNSVPSYAAGLVRGFQTEGEYASPRPHGVPVPPRSRTPPVNVIVGLGIRSMTSNQYDHLRQEEAQQQDRSSSISTLTSGDSDEQEVEDLGDVDAIIIPPDEEVAKEMTEMVRRAALRSSTSEDSVTKEDEDERQRENVDAQWTEEDDIIEALTKQQAIVDTSLTQDEIVDMRRATDPFAVRVIDPIKAIRAHSTNREWKVIKQMLKNNDLRAKDEVQLMSMNEEGRLYRIGEDADEFDNEIVTDNLGNVRPVGPKDEEDYRNNWLTVRMDTSCLSFARDSYWKDKRFITPRKLERQNSTSAVDEGVLARNALKALSITRTLAGGKVLEDTADLTQGEEIRNTLELWDMRATERNEEGRHRKIANKCDESLISASRELDFDYDMAMLTALRVEYKILENELKSQIGSPSSAYASERLAKQKKYLDALLQAGAGGAVVLQNPRDDPIDQQELAQRLGKMWGVIPMGYQGPQEDRVGTSNHH
uniref:RING-type E3 ubiquitin transferase n=1 Tax=Pristionchus pacificus TaxID=54126 RepID=A0A8R1UE34_PRIPA